MVSFLNNAFSFAQQLSRAPDPPHHDYEPRACYSSFCNNWQQAYYIIVRSEAAHLDDDVHGVVNHLKQVATLLVLEAKALEDDSNTSPISCFELSCLEYLLSENLLDKLYKWAVCTGKYENAIALEQLRLYGIIISHYSAQIIATEPVLKPLLKLLSGLRNELSLPTLESQLVTVLNQLCVALMQNMSLLNLFFVHNRATNGPHDEFIIVRLLLLSVHQEGATGVAARDALLLCAKMSAHCTELAQYMLEGSTCSVLAAGLRYSMRTLNQVIKLTFIDSLEFCNAVAQVAHPSIKNRLQRLFYQEFLMRVMVPALLQSGANEQAAAMLYLEPLVRCVSERGLLRSVLHFLFVYEYDGVRIIDIMLRRLEGNSQLSLVSLALMETLIGLNCEDVMLELVYKYLLTGHHLACHRVTDPEPYREAAAAFLTLSPNCCSRPIQKTRQWVEELATTGRRVLEFRDSDRRVNGGDDITMGNLVVDFGLNYGTFIQFQNLNETFFGNYHAYLCDARFEIISRTTACANWTSKYDCVKRETNNNKETREIDPSHTKEQDSLISICTSEYDTLKTSDTSEKDKEISDVKHTDSKVKEHDSLISIGDSSDYESLCKESDDSDEYVEEMFRKRLGKVEETREYEEVATTRTWRRSAETIIGPLLSSLLNKADALLQSDVAVNSRVTSVICKLASLPTPLLTSLLLAPSCVVQNVPSLYQILSKLKDEVDDLTDELDNWSELVDKARVFLMQREAALVTARAPHNVDAGPAQGHDAEPLRGEDPPFKRMEPKRRSIISDRISIFTRRLSYIASSPPQTVIQMSPTSQKRHVFTQESYWSQSITHRTILNAVLLDEWLKELAALCEEHALKLASDYYEDDSYIRTVAL